MAQYNRFFLLVAAGFVMVSGASESQRSSIREAAIPILTDCGRELEVDRNSIIRALQSRNPDILNSCFYACFLKKIGIINEEGLYDPAVTKQLYKKYIKSDLETLKDIIGICTKVNSQPASDGAKGCERSNMLIHCLIDNKGDLALIGA